MDNLLGSAYTKINKFHPFIELALACAAYPQIPSKMS